jgi:hypothetical protein
MTEQNYRSFFDFNKFSENIFCVPVALGYACGRAMAQGVCYTQLFLSLVLSNYSFYVCPSAPTNNTNCQK